MTNTMREFPFTLPSLNIVTVRIPVPMTEQDFDWLMKFLHEAREALTQEAKPDA